MHRPFIAWIVGSLVGLFIWSHDAAPQQASQPRNARLAYAAVSAREAGTAFAAMAKDSATTGKPPRQTNEAVRALLDLIFDTKVIVEERPFGYEDAPSLIDWLQALAQIGPVYLFAGTGISDVGQATPEQIARAEAQVAMNTVEFAPEIGRTYDAALTVDAAVMTTVVAVQSDNPRAFGAAGLAQFKAGVLQTATGLLSSLEIEGLSDSWRLDRIAMLIKVAPAFAEFMSPVDLKSLGDRTLETALRLNDSTLQGGLQEFAEGLQR